VWESLDDPDSEHVVYELEEGAEGEEKQLLSAHQTWKYTFTVLLVISEGD
jgi:hypothetical protein